MLSYISSSIKTKINFALFLYLLKKLYCFLSFDCIFVESVLIFLLKTGPSMSAFNFFLLSGLYLCFPTRINFAQKLVSVGLWNFSQSLFTSSFLEFIFLKSKYFATIYLCENLDRVVKKIEYRKVASSSLSQLVAHFQIFRGLMKEKFDAYVLLPLAKKFQN